MGDTARSSGGRQCGACGDVVQTIYTTPECGVFASCGCGLRPLVQIAPSIMLYATTAGILFLLLLLYLLA